MKTELQRRVNEICKDKGVLLKDVASEMGMSYQSLFSILTRNPTLSNLEKLAKTIGVSVISLLEDTGTAVRCPHCGKTFIPTHDKNIAENHTCGTSER